MHLVLDVSRTVNKLLDRASARYAVTCELARHDVINPKTLSVAERRQAAQWFEELVYAERLRRKMERVDQELLALKRSGSRQNEDRILLQQQLATASMLYSILRRVSRERVRRPDGAYVRPCLINRLDRLYKLMSEMRRELKRPQDDT